MSTLTLKIRDGNRVTMLGSHVPGTVLRAIIWDLVNSVRLYLICFLTCKIRTMERLSNLNNVKQLYVLQHRWELNAA